MKENKELWHVCRCSGKDRFLSAVQGHTVHTNRYALLIRVSSSSAGRSRGLRYFLSCIDMGRLGKSSNVPYACPYRVRDSPVSFRQSLRPRLGVNMYLCGIIKFRCDEGYQVLMKPSLAGPASVYRQQLVRDQQDYGIQVLYRARCGPFNTLAPG